jgi:hypothetical protein
MKTCIRVLLAALIFNIGQGALLADGGYSFGYTVEQKKEAAGENKSKGPIKVKSQNCSYQVTMENKSFKDIPQMEVKYVVFTKQPQAGGPTVIGANAELNRHAGTADVKALKNGERVTFTTEPVLLKTSELDASYYYTSGASSTARGALRGLWIRVFVGGQLVAEYTDPAELKTKTTFDAPAK